MLRRFEAYTFHPRTTNEEVDELARVLRGIGRYIPEVLESAVGRNRSGVGIDFVWEQAYEDADAYARYMRHPYHICILDRYLLPEAPECITASRPELQVGLFGYEIDDARFRQRDGVRRAVLMKVPAEPATDDFDAFASELTARPASVRGMTVSIVAANTMGLEWVPDGWTHVWEQAYTDDAAREQSVVDEAKLLDAGPVTSWVDLYYMMERDPA